MKKVLIVLSITALVMLIVPAIGVYLGKVELETCKHWMLAATILWFATAPFWMRRKAQ